MIFTDRIITVRKGESKINEPIIVYRGDYELEVRFTIMNSKFKFMSGTNLIESENAAYGQLAILTPYGGNIFSEVAKCNEGTITFVLTKAMLDQIEEVGLYSFQIRLFDYRKESRVSIPPVEFGIEVREPITSEDHDNSVNNAIVGYSIAKIADALNEKVPDTFNSNGDYNKTIWETGDRITEGKLNKIEDALDKINQNEKNDVATLDKKVNSNFNVLASELQYKMNVGSTIKVSQIDKNAGKLDQTYMSDAFLQQIAGNTPINAIPADNSITNNKIANHSITEGKIFKRRGNLLHGNSIEVNFKELKVKVLSTNIFIIGDNGYVDYRSITENGLPEISIPEKALDTNTYTQFSLWISNSGMIDFTSTANAPTDAVILADFYQGKPFTHNIGYGLVIIDKYGRKVETNPIQVKETLRNEMNELSKTIPPVERVGCIVIGSVNVDVDSLIMTVNARLVMVNNGYHSINESVTFDFNTMPNPYYAKFLYFRENTKDFIVMNDPGTVPVDHILICVYYNGTFTYSGPYYANLYINGYHYHPTPIDNSAIGSGAISSHKLTRPQRAMVNTDTIEVNFQDLEVKVLTGDTYYVAEDGYHEIKGENGTRLSNISIPENALTTYVLWSLWYDKDTKSLQFTYSKDAKKNGVELASFYRGKPYITDTSGGIRVIDIYGNSVLTSFKQVQSSLQKMEKGGLSHTYFYSNNVAFKINIDKSTGIISVTKTKGWLFFEDKSLSVSAEKTTEKQVSIDSIDYAFKLYINKNTGEPKIYSHDSIIGYGNSDEAFVCIFSTSGLYSPTFNPKVIEIDGKTPNVIGGLETGKTYEEYKWDDNRFVLPNNLYLVKDIPYSIYAPNFNMVQMIDNDSCLFEIGLPTKVVQFEQTAEIQIPFSYDEPYRTRVAGKYKGANTILTKDLYIHVADPSNVVKKDVKILCIGDSITNSNYPKHLKWQLKQFGINATMIGTVTNSHETYSYGISQHLAAEKGEGRGGWRLTDFTCTTPLNDGGYYINTNFPMMNPSNNKFDFAYYMNYINQNDVDFVIINLGTNDISGYHYAGSVSTNSAYQQVRKVDLETEYLNVDSEYYLGKQYKILIDSIHAFNPSIKIGINPPMTADSSNFIVKSMKWAEIVQYEFEDDVNVYPLGSYLGAGQLSVSSIEGTRQWGTKINDKNDTLKMSIYGEVHFNGIGQLIHTLYPASWIVNMCL